jgi:hypothetical protein
MKLSAVSSQPSACAEAAPAFAQMAAAFGLRVFFDILKEAISH